MFVHGRSQVVVPFVVPFGSVALVPVLPEPDELPVDDAAVAVVFVLTGVPVWIVSVDPLFSL